MRNAFDGIYQNGGDQVTLAPTISNGGYNAVINIALDLTNTEAGESDAQGTGGPGGSGIWLPNV